MNLIEKISAEFVFGEISTDRLPSLAVELIEAGYDSPSLRKLSGCLSDDGESRSLFVNAVKELGAKVPSTAEAGLILACVIAGDVVQGTLEPYVGAKRIWDKIYTRVPEVTELRSFVGLASEYEDDRKHRGSYSRDIADQCRKLLALRSEPHEPTKASRMPRANDG